MSRWATVTLQGPSRWIYNAPGEPEVKAESYVWEVELERFNDFDALCQVVTAAIIRSHTSFNSIHTDEEKLSNRYVMRSSLNDDDDVITMVGEACKQFAAVTT